MCQESIGVKFHDWDLLFRNPSLSSENSSFLPSKLTWKTFKTFQIISLLTFFSLQQLGIGWLNAKVANKVRKFTFVSFIAVAAFAVASLLSLFSSRNVFLINADSKSWICHVLQNFRNFWFTLTGKLMVEKNWRAELRFWM